MKTVWGQVWAGALLGSVVVAAALAARAQEEAGLFDTGTALEAPATAEMLAARTGWTAIDEGRATHAFKGDAVLLNGRMAVVLRRKAGAAEIYARGADGATLRGRLVPLADGSQLTMTALARVAVKGETATVEASFRSGKGAAVAVRYSLAEKYPILATTPGVGAAGQRLEAPARLGVLPDFFADDMVVDARSIPVDRTEVPSENFFMNMLDNGNAIVTAIWDKNKRDVELTLEGPAEARMIAGVDVFYGDGGSIWIAALEEKGIWSTAEIVSNNVKNVIALDWKAPWKAKWRGDFMRVDHTVDSWGFAANPQSRGGWSGVVGGYENPCWFDVKTGTNAFIQAPIQFPNGKFEGPFVVYPIDRTADTPLDRLTIVDVMRNSLGVGPCEDILKTVGPGAANKGIYTCSIEHSVPPVFDFGQQKEERVWIEMMCREVQVFVKAIQDRINGYVAFRGETLKYLEEQKAAHPEQAAFMARLSEQTKRIQANPVNNAAPVAKLVAELRAEIMADVTKANAGDLCGGIAGVGLGGDNTVARCRQAVKVLRQMATIEMALNPKSADVAKEMRQRTQHILRGPLGHEMI